MILVMYSGKSFIEKYDVLLVNIIKVFRHLGLFFMAMVAMKDQEGAGRMGHYEPLYTFAMHSLSIANFCFTFENRLAMQTCNVAHLMSNSTSIVRM